MAKYKAPVFIGLSGMADGPDYVENGAAIVMDSDVTMSYAHLDALNNGLGNYDGATLTIARKDGANANDVFGIVDGDLIEGQSFTVDGVTVGKVTTNANGPLLPTFGAEATSALVNQTVQSLTYANLSEAEDKGLLSWTMEDGTGSRYSRHKHTLLVNVIPVNDAPLLDSSHTPVLQAMSENPVDADNTGTSIADLVPDGAISDPDGEAVKGIAVTSVDNSHGVWQYSLDNGDSWNHFSATTGQSVDLTSQAILLDGTLTDANTNIVRFVPDADYSGTDSLTFRAWDKSAGAAGDALDTHSNGETTAFSTEVDTATVSVGHTNVIPTASDSNRTLGANDLYLFSASDFGFSDLDAGDGLVSITLVTLPEAGTLTLNHSPVSANQVIDSSEITRLLFTPDANASGTAYASFTFTVSDGKSDSVEPNRITFDVSQPPAPAPTELPSTPTEVPSIPTNVPTTPINVPQTPTHVSSGDVPVTDVVATPDQGDAVEVVHISPAGRHGSAKGTEVPFQFDRSNPDKAVTTLSLPSGLGARVLSNDSAKSHNQFSNLMDLIRSTGANAEDVQDTENAGAGFLNGADSTDNIWVNAVTLTGARAASDAPVQISGVEDSTQQEALVLNARGVAHGARIHLDNIEFAFVSGNATVTGGAGQNTVRGDDDQVIQLGAEDDELHGGGGNDIIGSEGGDDQLLGDRDNLANYGMLLQANDHYAFLAIDNTRLKTLAILHKVFQGELYTLADFNADATSSKPLEAFATEAVQQWQADNSFTGNGFTDNGPSLAQLNAIQANSSSLTQLATELSTSEAYQTQWAMLDDSQFVTTLATEVLDTPFNQTDIDYWTGRLNNDLSRADVFVLAAGVTEYQTQALENGLLLI